MTYSLRRRLGAAGLAAALGAGLALAQPGTANAAVGPDAAPVAGSSTWLAGQLTDGALFNEQFRFNDYSLSVDVGLAMAALGNAPVSADVADALEDPAALTSYVGDGTTESYAGSVAKTIVLAQLTARDPTAFGGTNLVERLEERVTTGGAAAGRIVDASQYGDYANVFGQAYAVQALDAAGSGSAVAATDFLLAQQCSEGFFRISFSAPAASDQTCDSDAEATPDVDATALAVRALLAQDDDTGVSGHIDDAVAWLVTAQGEDGSFTGGSGADGANSNSTGLAAVALGMTGETDAAAKAATWVAGLQQTVSSCSSSPLRGDIGAIAYDPAGLAKGQAEGITVKTQDQWRRATAQAAPALRYIASAPTTAPVTLTAPAGYQAAGSRVTLRIAGLGAGEKACVGGVGVTGPATSVSVTLPAGTATRSFRVERLGAPSAVAAVQVLGAKRLPVKLTRAKARPRALQRVRVTGLAAGETVRVYLRGKRVAAGKATRAGVFVKSFRVGTKVGHAKVKVVGHFANRTSTKTFRVVR